MKKTILVLIGLLASVCIFAQVDSTVGNATTTTVSTLSTFFTAQTWSVIATILGVLFAISETLPFVKKWENTNGILQSIFLALSKIFTKK